MELDHDGATLADLGSRLGPDATFVVVARPALGTLNHTALTLEALDGRELSTHGVVLGTWPDEPGVLEHGNIATLGAMRPLLGVLPERASELPPLSFRTASAHWLNGACS
ncbi:ATP-dependent dethiobiotin synthetase BioD [bacterium RCC_150]